MSSDMVFNLIISIISLIISCGALFISWRNHQRGKFNIAILPIAGECVYTDPLDTIAGNAASIVLHIRIINNSSYPLTISSFEHVDCNFEPKSWKTIIKNYNITLPTGEGEKVLLVSDEYINQPTELNPYSEIIGYLIFPYAPTPKSNKIDKLNFKIVTSRGEKTFNCNVITQEFINSWFN